MRLVILSLTAVLALSGCGSRDGIPRGGPGASDPFSQARIMARRGDCAHAAPILSCVAANGPGFEAAVHELARCHAELGDDEAAVAEFTRAANAGWAASQAELAGLHAGRGDGPEAAYWAAVYRANSRDQALGIARLPAEAASAEARLEPAERDRARERAAGFTPVRLEARPETPQCERLRRRTRHREPRLMDGLQPQFGS